MGVTEGLLLLHHRHADLPAVKRGRTGHPLSRPH
jgi:hypothetical protein